MQEKKEFRSTIKGQVEKQKVFNIINCEFYDPNKEKIFLEQQQENFT